MPRYQPEPPVGFTVVNGVLLSAMQTYDVVRELPPQPLYRGSVEEDVSEAECSEEGELTDASEDDGSIYCSEEEEEEEMCFGGASVSRFELAPGEASHAALQHHEVPEFCPDPSSAMDVSRHAFQQGLLSASAEEDDDSDEDSKVDMSDEEENDDIILSDEVVGEDGDNEAALSDVELEEEETDGRAEDLSTLSLRELRELCKAKGVPSYGKKAVVIERLLSQ